jgi:hypothetical protein
MPAFVGFHDGDGEGPCFGTNDHGDGVCIVVAETAAFDGHGGDFGTEFLVAFRIVGTDEILVLVPENF